jgi:hypothetical protein
MWFYFKAIYRDIQENLVAKIYFLSAVDNMDMAMGSNSY